MTIKTIRLISFISSTIGAATTVASVVMAIKEKSKAKPVELPENATLWQKVKATVPNYKKTIALTTISIGANMFGAVLGSKTQGWLLGATGVTYAGYNQYKDKVQKVLGSDAANKIKHEMGLETIKHNSRYAVASEKAKEANKKLYRISIDPIGVVHDGKPLNTYIDEPDTLYNGSLTEVWFIADPLKMHSAWEECLKKLSTDYEVRGMYAFTLYDFLTTAEAEFVNPQDNNPDYLNWGWDADYLNNVYHNVWVDIDKLVDKVDDQQSIFTDIVFKQDIIFDPGTNEKGRKIKVASTKEDIYNECFDENSSVRSEK